MPLSLQLGVRTRQFNVGGGERGKALVVPDKSSVQKTLKRDDYTCQVCGFRSEKYQGVISSQLISFAGTAAPAGDGALDGGLPNSMGGFLPDIGGKVFVTVCQFCELCVSLDRIGLSGSGILIWLPEISQIELNHLARAIYVAKASGDQKVSPVAGKILDTLTARRADAKKRIGTDDPMVLAAVLAENTDQKERAVAIGKLDGIRLLPQDRWFVHTARGYVDVFSRIVAFWRSPDGAFATLPVASWSAMLEKVA